MLPINTKAERKVVYQKALELVNSEDWCVLSTYKKSGLCAIISNVCGRGGIMAMKFKELGLFENQNDVYWWPIEDRASREVALMFCIEMCND